MSTPTVNHAPPSLRARYPRLFAATNKQRRQCQPDAPALAQTLCDHAVGNYRILTTLAAELLAAAAQRESPQLDEKLYLELFASTAAPSRRRGRADR